jgi:phospholipase C
MRWARASAVPALVALVATAAASSASSVARGRPGPTAWSASRQDAGSTASGSVPAGIHKIRHVVVIMQENRSFDNYFGTYPGAVGIPGLGGHPGKVPCIPDPKRHRCVRPFHDRQDFNHGGPHARGNSFADIDHGKMNGFIAQQERSPHWASWKPADDVMGYHTGADIPNYWAYAQDFVLDDHMFAPVASWSLPVHLYLVSLWSAHCTRHDVPRSCRNDPSSPAKPLPTIYAWTDLTYLLHNHHVSWRYYIFRGIEPDCDSNLNSSCAPVTQGPTTNPIWNPLHFFDTVKRDHQLGNIKSINAFFAAAHKGALPAVSWIVPNGHVSEHPATAPISPGQTYVTGLVNTIMQSPDWDSTAIFLAWDDWGGMYDNLRPPRVDGNGYGLRVPALMISPYARQGYVDHQDLSFDAYAKFIEDDFLGGQRLNPKTDGRPDPRPDVREKAKHLGDLLSEFNFDQTPLSPVILPVHPATDLKH